MHTLARRRFLQGSATAAAGFALAAPLAALAERTANADDGDRRRQCDSGFGPLSPRPAENDGVTYLALPARFRYWAISQVGAPMANGQPTPGAHDGMAAFGGKRGKVVIVRNHEQQTGTPFHSPAYDAGCLGGTTTLVFDPRDPANPVVTPSLSGTFRNCAGGATPWGTWLTCEETTGDVNGVPHGYVFEVPADGGSSNAVPYKGMGRFAHEAVAVDPKTLNVYETEDAGSTSGFYRFEPRRSRHGRPDLTRGTLSMLAVVGQPSADLYLTQAPGTTYDVDWVDIDPAAVDAPATAAGSAPWIDGRAKGGAAFRRLEGAWWSEEDRAIYFNSTDGGGAASGQVWAYRPNRRGGPAGQLTMIYESPSSDTLLKPDNLTITPAGGVLLCEDTDNARQTFIRGVSADGGLFDIAANVREGLKPGTTTPAMFDEFAGATFSPDGRWLFVNIQTPGVTFAIRGPWC